jgi:hypothetical protein
MIKPMLKFIASICALAVIVDILIMLAHRLGMEFAIPWMIVCFAILIITSKRRTI